MSAARYVGVPPRSGERMITRSSSSPYADERSQTAPSFSYVSSRGMSSGDALLELALQRPRVEVDAEALERGLDLGEHRRNRVAVQLGQGEDVLAVVAVLRRLLAPSSAPRRTRGTARSALRRRCSSTRARPRARRASSSRATASPYAPLRPSRPVIGPVGFAETISTWIRCLASGLAGSEARPGAEHLAQRLAVPLARQPQIDEAWAGDLGALDLGEPGRAAPPVPRPARAAGACAAPASRSATLVAYSPCAESEGRSSSTSVPASSPSDCFSRSSALGGDTCSGWREQVFEGADVVARPDADDHVTRVEDGLRRGTRVVRASSSWPRRRSRRRCAPGHADRGSISR